MQLLPSKGKDGAEQESIKRKKEKKGISDGLDALFSKFGR